MSSPVSILAPVLASIPALAPVVVRRSGGGGVVIQLVARGWKSSGRGEAAARWSIENLVEVAFLGGTGDVLDGVVLRVFAEDVGLQSG